MGLMGKTLKDKLEQLSPERRQKIEEESSSLSSQLCWVRLMLW
jgi:hypothetical protein